MDAYMEGACRPGMVRMGIWSFVPLSLSLSLPLGVDPSYAQSIYRQAEVQFTYFTIVDYTVLPGQQLRAWTTSPSGVCDPVIHLLRRTTDTGWMQYAYSDNASGLNPDLTYTMPADPPYNTLRIILRSKTYGTRGTATLNISVNGVVPTGWPKLAQVGGNLLPASLFPVGQGERLHAVPMVGGPTFSADAAMPPANGDAVVGVVPFLDTTCYGCSGSYTVATTPILGGGAGGAVSGDTASYHSGYLVGVPCRTLRTTEIACYGNRRSGWGHLYVNDTYQDGDGDGLGAELEEALGTCDSLVGCAYDGTKNPVDTDRDGLTDAEELLGFSPSNPNDGADLSFPSWGADPRHKDAFVEFDVAEAVNPFIAIGAVFADLAAQSLAEGPSDPNGLDILRNPDGEDGIALHLDLGVAPVDALETRWGDYPSNSARFTPDGKFWTVHSDTAQYMLVRIRNGQVVYTPDDCTVSDALACAELVVAKANASALLAHRRGGDPLYTIEIEPLMPNGNVDQVSLECAAGTGLPFGACPVEFLEPFEGSAAYTRHHAETPTYVDQSRAGRFRYAVAQDSGTGQSSGGSLYINCNPAPGDTGAGCAKTFLHEVGHTLGLSHWGVDRWGGYAECSPNYFSVMNYMDNKQATSSSYSALPQSENWELNPSALDECTPVPDWLSQVVQDAAWSFPVFTFNGLPYVDWNKNGIIDCGVLVQAAPFADSSDNYCKPYTGGEQKLPFPVPDDPDPAVSGPLDITVGTINSAPWIGIFTSNEVGDIYYRWAWLGTKANASCSPGNDGGRDTNCLSFTVQNLGLGEQATGVSAMVYNGFLWVSFRRAQDNALEIRRYANINNRPEFVANGPAFVFPWSLRYAPEMTFLYDVNGNPVLTVLFTKAVKVGLLWLFPYYMTSYSPNTNTWSAPIAVVDGTGASYFGPGSPSAAPWPDIYNTAMNAGRKTCALFPLSQSLRFACYDSQTGRWPDLTAVSFPPSPCAAKLVDQSGVCVPRIFGKPELAFVPDRLASGVEQSPNIGIGKFLLIFQYRDSDLERQAKVWTSERVSSGSPPGVSPMWAGTLSSRWRTYFSNGWADLDVNSNLATYVDSRMGGLMGAAVYRGKPNPLYFYPHADGSPNGVFVPGSDFEGMEDGLCTVLGGSAFCGAEDF